MRKLLVLVLLLAPVASAQTWSWGGGNQSVSSAGSLTTGTFTVAAGGSIAVACGGQNTSITCTPSDLDGDTFTCGASYTSNQPVLGMCLATTVHGNSAETVTCTFSSGGGSYQTCVALESSTGSLSMDTGSSFPCFGHGSSSASSLVSGSCTTTVAKESILVFGVYEFFSTPAATFSAGAIGGTTATYLGGSTSSGASGMGAEYLNVTTIQTGITGALTISPSQSNGWTAGVMGLYSTPPSITTTSVPNDTVNVTYPSTTLAASGGTPPYTWSVTSGSLPTGLSLGSSSGTISGTPTVVNTYNFTVQVTDSASLTGSKSFTITIYPLNLSDPLNVYYAPSNPACSGTCPSYVWLTNDMVKVRQDSGSPGTGQVCTMWGVPNEWVACQVHFQAPSTENLTVAFSTSGISQTSPSSYTISTASTQYSAQCWREGYQDVSIISYNGPGMYNATGYYPDMLIPPVDPYWHQTTNAWPFSVTSGQNQSAWCEVLIPSAAPAGYYNGSITVSAGGTTVGTYPVVLGVWSGTAFPSGYMPSTPTFQFAAPGFGYGSLCSQSGLSSCSGYPNGVVGEEMDGGAMLIDHRMSLDYADNFPGTGSFASFNSQQGPLFNGTNPGLNVSTLLSGPKLEAYQLQCSGGCAFNSTTASIFANWVSNFTTQGWMPTLNYQICDEPTAADYTDVNSDASASRGYSTPNVPMSCFTNIQMMTNNSGLNSIDWVIVLNFCMQTPQLNTGACGSVTGNQRSTYNAWLTGNCCSGSGPARKLWSYISCSSTSCAPGGSPGGGSSENYFDYDVDAYPATNRGQVWNDYQNNISGESYYLFDGCFYTGNGCPTNSIGATNGSSTITYVNGPAFTAAWVGTVIEFDGAYYTIGSYVSSTQLTLTATFGGTTANYTYVDPLTNIYEYANWGDGELLYPGIRSYLGTGVSADEPIWLPSMRLDYIRDGIQDYEYMNLLTNKGEGTFVTSQVNGWITNGYTFNQTNAPQGSYTTDLVDARCAMGAAIHQLTYPSASGPVCEASAGGATVTPTAPAAPLFTKVVIAKNLPEEGIR